MIYVVFKNRTSTLIFFDLLKRLKVRSKVVSTPKKIMASCGLSVEVGIENLKNVILLLRKRKYSDFVGVYKNKLGESYFEKLL